MKCPKCQFENREGEKFCAECGHVFELTIDRIPFGLKAASAYLCLLGILSLLGLLEYIIDGFSTEYPINKAYYFGAITGKLLISAFPFVSGIGLFFKKSWARKLALFTIVIFIPMTGMFVYNFVVGFAKSFSGSEPTRAMFICSFIFAFLWNAFWFYLLYRKSSKDALS